jgi:hypothetical protein
MTKSAAAAEALNEQIPFTFEGVDYLLDPTSEWDYEALEAYESGKIATFLRLVLGEKQHNAFKATKPKVGVVNEFVKEIQKALGLAGN